MALDGIFLFAITAELENSLINAKIDKVNQPEKDEIIFTVRAGNKNRKLLISASSNYPRVHFTEISKPNPQQAPMFCMLLRKYLVGSKIVSIDQLGTDRVLSITFESTDEMGFNSLYSLIVEIMGRHSNITLIRKRDNVIMDSIKHITPDINSYRCLYPGIQYKHAPSDNKLNPFDFTESDFKSKIVGELNGFKPSMFSTVFSGVSTLLSKEIYAQLEEQIKLYTENSITEFYTSVNNFFSQILSSKFEFNIYMDELNNYKDFYCISLSTMDTYGAVQFENASALLESFYSTKDKQDRLGQKSSDLQKLVTNNIDRCAKKSEILKNNIKECEKKDRLQLFGELLTANIHAVKKGDKNIAVFNYYSEVEEYITIPLDENISPSANVQHYYKRYNKLKKTEVAALEQLHSNESEINYLQSVLTNIRNAESYEEIEEIRKELVETGYIRFRKSTGKEKKTISKPLHYKSSDGFDIYVGKNNIQNDFLTLKFAEKHDIWMHTKDIPGSHVIIKNTGKISDKTLEEAAVLAAFYSKAKDSTKVPVDYTEVKNVKKPSGSKPGMVIYYTNKTIYVDPFDIKLQKL